MKCNNCHVNLSDNSKYCPRCGILFESDDVEKYTKVLNSDLLSIYFKDNNVGFTLGKYNFWYLLFGFFYALYQKMYKEAFYSFINLIVFIFILLRGLYFIFDSYGFMFFGILLFFILPIVFHLYYAYIFNDLMITNKTIRLNKIIKENQDKSEVEIINILEQDSKGNIFAVLASIILIFIIGIIITFM